MTDSVTDQLRRCLREPIPEIADAARLLDAATTAHLMGEYALVGELIRAANMPAVREWTNSLWGANSPHVLYRGTPSAHPRVPSEDREAARMPSSEVVQRLHDRDGYHCRFCGIPIIRREIRLRFIAKYPELKIWGRTNNEQHAAFQAMWVQYDHVVPHARGGSHEIENLVVTCAPCNYGRMSYTLEEVNLADPREREPVKSNWDGLERFR